jgi:hypothetical protein
MSGDTPAPGISKRRILPQPQARPSRKSPSLNRERNKNMKITILSLLLAICLWPGCRVATAQDDPGATAAITFGNQQSVRVKSNANRFSPVGVSPGDTISVTLMFPIGFAGTAVTFDDLDGSNGLLNGNSGTIDGNGIVSFQFLTPIQAGLYRVLVTAATTTSALQFSVASQ